VFPLKVVLLSWIALHWRIGTCWYNKGGELDACEVVVTNGFELVCFLAGNPLVVI